MNKKISINVDLNLDELCNKDAIIKLFKEDVEPIFRKFESAYIGVGYATGADMAKKAARNAITNSVMDIPLSYALGVIIRITASSEFDMDDIEDAIEIIRKATRSDSKIVFNFFIDELLINEIRIDIIATK